VSKSELVGDEWRQTIWQFRVFKDLNDNFKISGFTRWMTGESLQFNKIGFLIPNSCKKPPPPFCFSADQFLHSTATYTPTPQPLGRAHTKDSDSVTTTLLLRKMIRIRIGFASNIFLIFPPFASHHQIKKRSPPRWPHSGGCRSSSMEKKWRLLRRQGRVIPETHVPLEPAHWFRVQVVSIIITLTTEYSV
jgi:hypothetical protein